MTCSGKGVKSCEGKCLLLHLAKTVRQFMIRDNAVGTILLQIVGYMQFYEVR